MLVQKRISVQKNASPKKVLPNILFVQIFWTNRIFGKTTVQIFLGSKNLRYKNILGPIKFGSKKFGSKEIYPKRFGKHWVETVQMLPGKM